MPEDTLDEPVIDLNAADVAQYLRQHPNFLREEFSDVLSDIDVPHQGTQGATSLIERQVTILREQQTALRTQIRDLIDIARANERLVARMHKLTQALILAPDLETMLDSIGTHARHEFHADAVRARFWTPSMAARVPATYVDLAGFSEHFATVIKRGHVVCGQFSLAQIECLFGASASGLQSVALLPITGTRVNVGLIAIGSKDPRRFHQGMSTVFLTQLAETISHVMRRHIPEAM